MIAFSTPYYVQGKQARSWHMNKGEKALVAAGASGLAAYGLKQGHLAKTNMMLNHTTGVKLTPEILGGAAVAAGAYSAYHYTRAARINSRLKGRDLRQRNMYNRTNEAFDASRRNEGNVG